MIIFLKDLIFQEYNINTQYQLTKYLIEKFICINKNTTIFSFFHLKFVKPLRYLLI